MTITALGALVWRHPLAYVAAKAVAPLGAAFTLLCLVTGSLWGRPEWMPVLFLVGFYYLKSSTGKTYYLICRVGVLECG